MMNRKKMEDVFRGIAVLLIGTAGISLASCGKTITYDPSKYVKLGDYSNLEVEISGNYSVEEAMASLIGSNAYIRDDSQTTVQEDSIVNVDYVGSQDGVPFDGGSAQDVTLDVKNNCNAGQTTGYIDGFTSGLVGATVGSTVDCNVTFPENYGVESLNGQTVVFTFTVNYIAKQMNLDEMTDEDIAANYGAQGYNSKADLKAAAEKQVNDTKDSDKRQAVISKMEEICEVTFPKGLLDQRVDDYIKRFKKSYLTDGQKLSDYLSQYGNSTEESFKDDVKTMVKHTLTDEMIFRAVAQKENLTIDETDFKSYLEQMKTSNNLKSDKELYEFFGKDEKAGEEYLRNMYLANKACDQIVKNAKVTETAETE